MPLLRRRRRRRRPWFFSLSVGRDLVRCFSIGVEVCSRPRTGHTWDGWAEQAGEEKPSGEERAVGSALRLHEMTERFAVLQLRIVIEEMQKEMPTGARG